jgi:imidazolonepropionase-like amidohydrolase
MLAIRSARLFDGERFASGPATVIVDGTTITGVERGWPDVPEGIAVLDVGEATVLPGLVDTHVHLVGDSGLGALDRVAGYTAHAMTQVVKESLRRQLAGGVTTVRDLGDRNWVAVDHRDRQRKERATGRGVSREPTVLASGPPITSPGGHCHYMGGEVHDLIDMARAVRERADRGVDIVKVMASGGLNTPGTDVLRTQFTAEEIAFLVQEAHRHGLAVTAHAHALPAVEQALAAGVDGMEHCSCLTENGVRVTSDVLTTLAERQIPIGGALGAPPAAAFAHAPAAIRALMARAGVTPETFKQMRLQTVRRMQQAGVRFVAGRDSGISPFLAHGSLRDDVAFYVEAGASVSDALAAATSLAADACGVGKRKGRIRPGHDADIMAVRGNLKNDVTSLANVRALVLAGIQVT